MASVVQPRDRRAALEALEIIGNQKLPADLSQKWVTEAYLPPAMLPERRAAIEDLAQHFADTRQPLTEALEACLLFFKGGAWTARDAKLWHELVGNGDQTSRALCDKIREVLGIPPREGEPR